MPNDQITFSCTSCGVELNVPLSFAGITGPCPGCQESITAPLPKEEKSPPAQQHAHPEPSPPSSAVPSPVPETAISAGPPTQLAPAQRQPLSAPAAAILAATPELTTTSEAPSPFPPETELAIPGTPAAVISNEAPHIPDFSIPSASPQEKESPVKKEKFPSVPVVANNPTTEKTLLPPRRAEVELPTPLVSSSPPAFPSALIPATSIPADKAHLETSSESAIKTIPTQEEIPILEPNTQATREITPPPEPTNASKASVPVPEFLGGTPSPATTPVTAVPQLEPQSGTTAYPVAQPPAPSSAPTAYPTAPTPAFPSQQAPPSAPPTTAGVATPAPASATIPPPASAAAEPLPVSHGLSTFSPPPKEVSANPAQAEQKKKKPKGKLWWLRIVIPILFLALCGLVVYLVTDLLQKVANDDSGSPQLNVPSAPNATARQVAKERVVDNDSDIIETTFSKAPKHLDPVSADVAAANAPKLYVEGEPPPVMSNSAQKKESDSIIDLDPSDAASVLDRFLKASNLEERLPLLSHSKRSQEELSNSSLAQPFPEVLHSRLLHYMVNNAERHTEHFFEVSFQKKLGERPYPILIQINDWGEGQCKIHTDAFLDLFEDQLSEFAAKPVAGTRTFHIVADAYKHCFDEIIPDWDKKSFLKLRNHPRMSPRLIAYFNRNSQMADAISRPDALPWGESGICTVTVAWNTDNPENPFVELIDVVGFTWEP